MISINRAAFEKVKAAGAQVLCVTKYWDREITEKILDFGFTHYPDNFLGLGENRISDLEAKNLDRNQVHFVGNLQSRNLKEIVRRTSVIHSLHKFSHLQKLEVLCTEFRWNVSVFLQINVSGETQKGGIFPEELPAFLEAVPDVLEGSSLVIAGLSAIGAGEFTIPQKRNEFQMLRELRDRYIPEGKISAGTSRDYEIALEEGIDIVRIGKALIEAENERYYG